jgi:HSP20 family protein
METHLQKSQNQEVPVREKHATREPGTYQGQYFEPPVDIYETEDALVILADIPGVEPADVQTDLRDNLLTLTAQLKPETPAANVKPRYREYRVGHYVRQFRLGQHIDQERISAELKDGVLKLTLPKAERARARKIQVRAG